MPTLTLQSKGASFSRLGRTEEEMLGASHAFLNSDGRKCETQSSAIPRIPALPQGLSTHRAGVGSKSTRETLWELSMGERQVRG